jgi:hypothetical protein
VGNAGTALTSTDGTTWITRSTGVSNPLFGLDYGAGQFVAVGAVVAAYYDEETGENVLLRSYDGATWESFRPPTNWNLDGVGFLSGSFWITGGNGAILQSDPISNQPMLSGQRVPGSGGFELTISGMSGQNLRIQVSTNLTAWTDAYVITNSQPVQMWMDVNASSSGCRYYRVVPQ